MPAKKVIFRDPETGALMKPCTRCSQIKPVDAFRWTGRAYRGDCRDCERAHNTASYAANPEAGRERQKRYAQRHPERVAARKKRYHLEHHEERLAAYRAYNEANLERRRAYDRERHRKETPEQRHAMKLRYWPTYRKHIERRVAMLKAASDGTKVDREALYERDNYTCHLCGDICTPESITLDHVIPLSRGGKHTADNLRVACRSCNSRKHARLPNESA